MNNNEWVTFHMATMPSRVVALFDTVNSILPQCDQLHIYLNNFEQVPSFLIHPKITTYMSQREMGDLGDVGKFYKVEGQKGYIFTVDDKIIYPPDYVAQMIATIERTNRKAVVSNHGRNFHSHRLSRSYYLDIQQLFSYLATHQLTFVHELGTGVMAWHSDTLTPGLDWFHHTNMTDIYFSLECQKREIPLLIHQHKTGWLRMSTKHDDSKSIHASCNRTDQFQTKVINGFKWKINTCLVENENPDANLPFGSTIKLYISTSDRTSHILPQFAWLLERYAPEIQCVKILGYSVFPKLSYKYDCISIADKQYNLTEWSRNLYNYFKSVNEKYILFGLEDFLLRSPIDHEMLKKALNMMESDKRIGRFELGEGHGFHTGDEVIVERIENGYIYKYGPGSDYKINTQFSIWRREYLLKYLNHDRTPAQFEVMGSKEAVSDGFDVMTVYGRPAFDYVHSGISNKFPGMINTYNIPQEVITEMISLRLLQASKIHSCRECPVYNPKSEFLNNL